MPAQKAASPPLDPELHLHKLLASLRDDGDLPSGVLELILTCPGP